MTFYRFLRILLLTAALASLIWYGHAFNPAVTVQMCLEHPERYNGHTIVVGNEATISKIHPDGFTIEQLGTKVRVYAKETNVRTGEFVIIKAIFRQPDILEAQQVRIAKKRRAKIWLSVVPVVFIVIYFFRRFRFNTRSFYFEIKS